MVSMPLHRCMLMTTVNIQKLHRNGNARLFVSLKLEFDTSNV